MLPLKIPPRLRHSHGHNTSPASLALRLSFITLLLLLAPACLTIEAEDACYSMKALELKADGKDPLEGATLGISFSTKFEISMPEVIGDTIESANNRNLHPELLLKSIRLTSQNDETYLFKKIEMVLTSPPGSFLPDAPIVDYEAPIVSWPANQLYIRANDINIIDYFVDGVCEAELNITTQHDILSFSVGFEVCMDGKVFWP